MKLRSEEINEGWRFFLQNPEGLNLQGGWGLNFD